MKRCWPSPLLFNTALEVLASIVRKKTKAQRLEQPSLHAGSMIMYIKNPKESKKLLNEFIKVSVYKINIFFKKSMALLHISNELENKKNLCPFTVV